MMYSAYKLNKQGDNIQPWHTPFPIWNQSVVPCPVLTVASWPAYRFLKRQVRWSGIPISFRIFHSLLWSTQSKALAVIDVFLELSRFLDDPADIGNLISGSSAFSKTGLNIWKFLVHILLKPGLENFEHYFTSMWDECDCVVVWAFFGIAFLWGWNENWPFLPNSLRPQGLYSPWNSLSHNTGMGSLSLLQGFFPTQGSNRGLLHCRQILCQLSYEWLTI